MNKIKKNAFTLVEMLISLTIFMIFMGIVAGSYTSLVSANKKANDAQKLYSEVRFIFDSLAQEIKNGSLDYSCIDPFRLDALCVDNQTSENKKILSILHENGLERSLFKFTDKKLVTLAQSRVNPQSSWASASGWQPLTTENFPLEDLFFKISPAQNPYEADYAASDEIQLQPAVTILLKTKNHVFRTTYSSRTYAKQS